MNTNRQIQVVVDRYRRELLQARPDRRAEILAIAEEELSAHLPESRVASAVRKIKTGKAEAW